MDNNFASQTEIDFYAYLLDQGIQANAIRYEPGLLPIDEKTQYCPDFAIIDPQTNDLIAIFEVTSNQFIDQAASRLSKYISHIGSETVVGVIVTPSETDDKFDLYIADLSGKYQKSSRLLLLKIKSAIFSRKYQKKELLEIKKNTTTKTFSYICYSVAFILLSLAYLDYYLGTKGITILTTERLTLIGASIAFLIIPYVQKLKFLGIEIERIVQD